MTESKFKVGDEVYYESEYAAGFGTVVDVVDDLYEVTVEDDDAYKATGEVLGEPTMIFHESELWPSTPVLDAFDLAVEAEGEPKRNFPLILHITFALAIAAAFVVFNFLR